MIAGYDAEANRVVLLAFPEELEELAQKMRQKQKVALAGEKTTIVSLVTKDFWTGQSIDMTVDIGYQQKW